MFDVDVDVGADVDVVGSFPFSYFRTVPHDETISTTEFISSRDRFLGLVCMRLAKLWSPDDVVSTAKGSIFISVVIKLILMRSELKNEVEHVARDHDECVDSGEIHICRCDGIKRR